jgi:hypothetical protein
LGAFFGFEIFGIKVWGFQNSVVNLGVLDLGTKIKIQRLLKTEIMTGSQFIYIKKTKIESKPIP